MRGVFSSSCFVSSGRLDGGGDGFCGGGVCGGVIVCGGWTGFSCIGGVRTRFDGRRSGGGLRTGAGSS